MDLKGGQVVTLLVLLRFRLACICDMTRSATVMACIVPVFVALGTWVACFPATKAFRSAVILILVKWLFASALAWRPTCSAWTKRRTAIRVQLVYCSGVFLRECSDIFLGRLGAERLFKSFIKIVLRLTTFSGSLCCEVHKPNDHVALRLDVCQSCR